MDESIGSGSSPTRTDRTWLSKIRSIHSTASRKPLHASDRPSRTLIGRESAPPARHGDAQHGPTVDRRGRRQARTRVHRPGVTDQRHQRDIFVAVGIKITALHVDAVVLAEALCRISFPASPDDGPLDVACQATVLVDGEVVAEQPVDAERASNRFGMDGQRRRAQRYRVPALLVGGHDLAHLRVDPRRDVANEEAVAQLVEFTQRLTLEISRGPHDQTLELHAAEPVSDRGLEHSENLSDPGLSAPDPVACVGCRGEARNQRAVQIEKRAHLRSFRARVDLVDPPRRLGDHHPRLRFLITISRIASPPVVSTNPRMRRADHTERRRLYRPGAAPSCPDSSSSSYCWPARVPCRPSPGLRSRPTASNWLMAGSSRRPADWAPTVRRSPVPTTRRRAGTPSGTCPRRSSKRCRMTARTPISTTARTCLTRCLRTSTSRTGGTARRSPHPPVTPHTCWGCPASTTAPRSG